MSLRLVRLFASTAGALLLTLLLNLLLAAPAVAGPLRLAAQARPAGPALAASETFSATVLLTVSTAAPAFGDEVVVTAQLLSEGTCRFTLYAVILAQFDPRFTCLDPPEAIINPPVPNPAVWRLRAVQAGSTTLAASFSGDLSCDGSEQWTTFSSEPQIVAVDPALTQAALPFVSRNTPVVPSIDLGTLGGDQSFANAINNRGEVVGVSRTAAGQDRAFLWRSGVMTDLGALDGDGGSASSMAAAINDRGQVTGWSTIETPLASRGFVWQEGVMQKLGTLGGSGSNAVDINYSGQVIGSSTTVSGASYSFLWTSGVMTDLGTLGGYRTEAVDLNDRGQVAGYTTTKDGLQRAFLWRGGTLVNVHPEDALMSEAIAINERGQVAGMYLAPGEIGGFVWENWVLTTFAAPDGGDIYAIDDFNERGQVVGTYLTAGGLRGFLWEKDADGRDVTLDTGPIGYVGSYCSTLIDDNGQIVLDSPTGPVLWQEGSLTRLASFTAPSLYSYDCPVAINNRGQIVGTSIDANGEYHAVLWEAR